MSTAPDHQNEGLAGHPLFVYGTLLRGQRNHHLMATARLVRETATAPGFRLYELDRELPAMVRGGRGAVAGELYRIDAETLERLDRLERHPDLYWRTAVRLVDGSTALTYLWRGAVAGGRTIDSGDWRRRHPDKAR